MRFLTPSECDAWVSKRTGIEPAQDYLSIELPPESGRLLFLARYVAKETTSREPCLLRITNCHIWPSSNNWHLYYRLRQSYGDRLLIDEAPGHVFLGHEAEDLATFLHLAMLFGWDAQLRPALSFYSAELSHDGFLDIYYDNRCLERFTQFRKVVEVETKFTAEMRTSRSGTAK